MCKFLNRYLSFCLFALVSIIPLPAVAADNTTPDSIADSIGIVGGSQPADGKIKASEHIPLLNNLPRLDVGRAASAKDIAAWDIDIRYDGEGLPAGEMNVEKGVDIYDNKCAVCHGDFGQGEGRWPVLTGGFNTLTNQGGSHRPEKTIGSYWPFVSTLYDYIRRAMPYNAPQTLSNDETYGLVAYILHLNDLVDENFVANAETLKNFKMPNAPNFYPDPRPDVNNTACMNNCRSKDELAVLETITGVTPLEHLEEINETMAPPESVTAAPDTNTVVAEQYEQFCGLCHNNGIANAPRLEAKADWQTRLTNAGTFDKLTESVINGKGAMPAKGGAVQLSDKEIAAIVKYILFTNDIK
ncbi:MAG: c-type cytochrome [Proteobacteria bacterium]|nr:c-type cytochrome [Pseudomonadota bacterium]